MNGGGNNLKLMDLHIHTDYSDGDLSPSQIIEEVM